MLNERRRKAREIHLPLWLMIILTIIGIGSIGFLLVVLFGGERWFPALAYLVAASAIAAGGCIAYHHLTILQGIERAHILTHLDTCWSNTELAKSREELLKFRNELNNVPGSTEWYEEIKNKLQTYKVSKYDIFKRLTIMLDFYETLGYFSKVGYILIRDTLELYGSSIRDYDEIFYQYISVWQVEKKDIELYENFIWLANELRKKYSYTFGLPISAT